MTFLFHLFETYFKMRKFSIMNSHKVSQLHLKPVLSFLKNIESDTKSGLRLGLKGLESFEFGTTKMKRSRNKIFFFKLLRKIRICDQNSVYFTSFLVRYFFFHIKIASKIMCDAKKGLQKQHFDSWTQGLADSIESESTMLSRVQVRARTQTQVRTQELESGLGLVTTLFKTLFQFISTFQIVSEEEQRNMLLFIRKSKVGLHNY